MNRADEDQRVHLVQVLCSERRHAIMALPYLPGMSAADQAGNDLVLTADNALDYVKETIERWLHLRWLNPWCQICGATSDGWFYEEATTIFSTMEEAWPHFQATERKNQEARFLFNDLKKRTN